MKPIKHYIDELPHQYKSSVYASLNAHKVQYLLETICSSVRDLFDAMEYLMMAYDALEFNCEFMEEVFEEVRRFER